MGSERLIWAARHIFPWVLWFSRNRHSLYSLGPNKCYTIALLYDIKFGITLLWFIWCQHKKPKQSLKLNIRTRISIADVAKILLIFLCYEKFEKCWNKSLHVIFFSFEKLLFKLILLVCSFFTRIFFSLAESGLRIWTRQIVWSLDVQFIYSFY